MLALMVAIGLMQFGLVAVLLTNEDPRRPMAVHFATLGLTTNLCSYVPAVLSSDELFPVAYGLVIPLALFETIAAIVTLTRAISYTKWWRQDVRNLHEDLELTPSTTSTN